MSLVYSVLYIFIHGLYNIDYVIIVLKSVDENIN